MVNRRPLRTWYAALLAVGVLAAGGVASDVQLGSIAVAATPKTLKAATPKITGTVAAGTKLRVTTGSWTASTKFSYQWFADKVAIPGATASTYTLTTSEQGKQIYVRVTGKLAGYRTATKNSAATKTVSLVDAGSKESVRKAYVSIVAEGMKKSTGWSGSVSGCKVGTESAASKKATLDAINFMRALVQLDGVRFSSDWNSDALKNSLMMEARRQITHTPSASGKCWHAAGGAAAKRSNIALEWGSASLASTTGARGVVGYMVDPGAGNEIVGHRRWLLDPRITQMGTGSTKAANTLTVFGATGIVASQYNAKPSWMEWPSAGYFPAAIEPAGRWSLSSSASGADFRKATIAVKDASGKSLKVTKHSVVSGYGPQTVSFQVSGIKKPSGSAVQTYTVKVSGIKGAAASSYTYQVKLFNA